MVVVIVCRHTSCGAIAVIFWLLVKYLLGRRYLKSRAGGRSDGWGYRCETMMFARSFDFASGKFGFGYSSYIPVRIEK